MNLECRIALVIAGLFVIVIVYMVFNALRDEKRARVLGDREGYMRGYRDARDGSPPEDW